MLLRATLAAILGTLIFSVSCNKSETGEAPATAPAGSAKAGSGGGFSSDLAAELVADPKTGSAARPAAGSDAAAAGSDAKPGSAAMAGDAKAGSAAMAGDAKAGSAAMAGDAKAGAGSDARAGSAAVVATNDAKTPGAKAGDVKAGDVKAGDVKAGDVKAADAKAASIAKASAGDTKVAGGDAKAAATAGSVAKPGDAAKSGAAMATKPGDARTGSASAAAVIPAPVPAKPAAPTKLTPELAAIKLSLLPNWDRDVDDGGSFQYVVRIKGTQATKTFIFRYGYDDPKAPVDREQYKKYLQDTHIMTGEIKDRQRGAAWFLEGADASGTPSFRYIVLYGGKRLICYGSLYKDADSNRLGDDRDQTVIQAKQICETLAL